MGERERKEKKNRMKRWGEEGEGGKEGGEPFNIHWQQLSLRNPFSCFHREQFFLSKKKKKGISGVKS